MFNFIGVNCLLSTFNSIKSLVIDNKLSNCDVLNIHNSLSSISMLLQVILVIAFLVVNTALIVNILILVRRAHIKLYLIY